jgi:hypothetical protein
VQKSRTRYIGISGDQCIGISQASSGQRLSEPRVRGEIRGWFGAPTHVDFRAYAYAGASPAVVALQRPSGLPVTRDFRGQDRSNGRQFTPQPRTSGKRSVLPRCGGDIGENGHVIECPCLGIVSGRTPQNAHPGCRDIRPCAPWRPERGGDGGPFCGFLEQHLVGRDRGRLRRSRWLFGVNAPHTGTVGPPGGVRR